MKKINKMDKNMDKFTDKKRVKRKIIAKSCLDLFAEHSLNNISVSEIAKTAKIGKGTIYEYFNNKEDIVCELMDSMQDDYDYVFKSKINEIEDAKDKVLFLFSIFTSDDEILIKQQEIYKQFLCACLAKSTPRLIEYNVSLRNKYTSLITEMMPNVDAYKMYDCITGFFIASVSLKDYDLKNQIISFIESEAR